MQKTDGRGVADFANESIKYRAEIINQPDDVSAYALIKRLVDLLFSILGLIVLIIPMIIIAIVVVRDSEGSPIFSQTRLGKDGKPFTMYKFRTMRLDAEADGARWASEHDSRVTNVGRFLRNTRLDELPQLINIIKGEMSIVGPRPERPEFYDIFDTYITGFRQRMYVKPGMTGLAQVNGGYSLQPEEKIVYDVEYIKSQSLLLDIKLIIKTVAVVFTGDKGREELSSIRRCEVIEESNSVEYRVVS